MADKRLTRSASKLKAQTSQPTLHDIFSRKSKSLIFDVDEPNDIRLLSSVCVDNTVSKPDSIAPPSPPSTGPIVIRAPKTKSKSTAAALDKLFPIFNKAKLSSSDANPPSDIATTIDISDINLDIVTLSSSTRDTVSDQHQKPTIPTTIHEGRSADNPIIVESSPPKPSSKLAPQFMKPPRRPDKGALANLRLEPPFPDQTCQHVRGPQTVFVASESPSIFARKVNRRVSTTHPGLPLVSSAYLDYLDGHPHHLLFTGNSDLPAEHIRRYPAIRRLLNEEKHDANEMDVSSLWVDKWSPRAAEHVLGNESNALYLRDWLKALELNIESNVLPSHASKRRLNSKLTATKKRGAKRPKVRREVSKRDKKRQKIGEGDWVVKDEYVSEPEAMDSEPEDNFEFLDASFSEFDTHVHDDDTIPPGTPKSNSLSDENDPIPLQYPRPDFSNLSNTIVLCGPPGSGKTAAIYACAAELCWEIFEAYPGVGKRNGAALDNLLGQAGRNHLVRKAQSTKLPHAGTYQNGNEDTPSSFLSNPTQEPPDDILVEWQGGGLSESHELDTASNDGFGFLSNSRSSGPGNQAESDRQVRQSLLLFEEADILYKDDVNFWPAVINIIKGCRRPVIITCNDISLVPVSDLPLQSILYFTACPSPVIVSYLQSLCIAEGMKVDRETLVRLSRPYESPSRRDYETSMRSKSYNSDLRRSIHELQFYCTTNLVSARDHDGSFYEDSWDGTFDRFAEWPIKLLASQDDCLQYLRSIDRHMTTVSLVDQSSISHVEECSGEYLDSADEEMGHKTLAIKHSTFRRDDISMSQEALVSSRRLFASSSFADHVDRFYTRNPELDTACAYHRSWMTEALESLRTPCLCEPQLFLDYEPFLRHSVYFDNKEEIGCIPDGGRRTRNSQRTYHVRWVELSAHQRQRLEQTGFRID